jgi:hypothetical protein
MCNVCKSNYPVQNPSYKSCNNPTHDSIYVCVTVYCEVWSGFVSKSPLNPITIPSPICSHSVTWQLVSEVGLDWSNCWIQDHVGSYRPTKQWNKWRNASWSGWTVIGFIEIFDTSRDYTLHYTVTHTHYCPHSCLHCCFLVAAFNSRHSSSSWFPDYPQLQLPTSKSNSSQKLNPNSSITHEPTDSSLTHSTHLSCL